VYWRSKGRRRISEGTIHHLVEKRLKEFAEGLKKLDKAGEDEKSGKSDTKDS